VYFSGSGASSGAGSGADGGADNGGGAAAAAAGGVSAGTQSEAAVMEVTADDFAAAGKKVRASVVRGVAVELPTTTW
jgi:hypothetical protein